MAPEIKPNRKDARRAEGNEGNVAAQWVMWFLGSMGAHPKPGNATAELSQKVRSVGLD